MKKDTFQIKQERKQKKTKQNKTKQKYCKFIVYEILHCHFGCFIDFYAYFRCNKCFEYE